MIIYWKKINTRFCTKNHKNIEKEGFDGDKLLIQLLNRFNLICQIENFRTHEINISTSSNSTFTSAQGRLQKCTIATATDIVSLLFG